MVAITSLASWLLLTPNQHSCFLAMFIAIVGQTVCFENAKSNSLMWKKEHLIGFQCFLCWFELSSNEDRWLNLFACMCVHTQVACIHYSRLYCCFLCVHEQVASGVTAHDITEQVSADFITVSGSDCTNQTTSELQVKQIFSNRLLIVCLIRRDTLH